MTTDFFVSKSLRLRLLILAVLCAFGSSYMSKKICDEYYSIHSYTPDPMRGLLKCTELKHRLANQGRWQVARQEFRTNPTDPFTVIPIVLATPSLLNKRAADLVIVFPMLAIFLFLMGYLMLYRGNSFLAASAVIICYSTSLALFAGYFGLSFFLKDTIASYPLAIAGICLWLWYEKKDTKYFYLILFAVFMSFAVLCRYAASVYSLVIFSPLCLYAFYKRFQVTKNFFESVFKPVLIVGSIVILLCGYFLIKNYGYNVNYYSYWYNSKEAATMNVGVLYSFKTFVVTYFGYFALFHSILFLIVFLFGIVLFLKARHSEKYEYLLGYWFTCALPLYWIIILQVDGQKLAGAFTIAFPIMFFGVFANARRIDQPGIKKLQIVVSWLLISVSLLSMPRTIAKCRNQIELKTSDQYKSLTVNLADLLIHYKPFPEQHLIVSDFAGDYLIPASTLEATYQWGIYIPFISNNHYLDKLKSLGKNSDSMALGKEMKEAVLKKATAETNVIVTFDDKENLKRFISNKINYEMACYVSDEMKGMNGWTKKQLNTDFGVLDIYFNDGKL